MEKTFIILTAILLNYAASACTFEPKSFCKTSNAPWNDLMVAGQIISIDSDGIDLQVIDILYGQETKATIRIWDGTDFDCNGPFSMAASGLGKIGDSVALILPKITEKENTWDIIGDYRTPNFYTSTPNLKIEQGKLIGLILGDIIAPPEYQLREMNYQEFKTSWSKNNGCSEITVSTNSIAKKPVSVITANPIMSDLILTFNQETILGEVSIYTLNGQKVKSKKFERTKELIIPFSENPSGMYLVVINQTNREPRVLKIVKI